MIVESSVAQISLLDKYIVVSRSGADVTIYFITPETENELIVVEAIEGFYEALRIYFKYEAFVCPDSVGIRSIEVRF